MQFLTANLNWVTLPCGFASPRWPQSFVPNWVVEALKLPIVSIPPEDVRTYLTPRGRIRSTRFAVLYVRAVHLNTNFMLVPLPILESETHGNLGVSMIIGRGLLDSYLNCGAGVPYLF
ncbi:4fab983e-2a61-444d-b47d-694ec2a4cdc0 [Thermothielavioides terrestris]|nr:4fab983e-2a61-444d-b47d-694ec2a4cdc0 [Thermothielavioides terrestris]